MSDRHRRKSLSIFRPTTSGLSPINDDQSESAPGTLKKRRAPSFLNSAISSSPPSPVLERTNSQTSFGRSSSPKSRPRMLQRSTRPSSLFGSLRSLHSLQDEDENLVRTISETSSLNEESSAPLDVANMVVLHHGEVQTAGGMFRKKSHYLVLTDTHLLRFKNQVRASEVFPRIPASLGRSNTFRHSRMSSGGSIPEAHISAESHSSIPLCQIVAVYKLDDGRPYFTIEVAYLDEESYQPSVMSLQLSDPRESEIWLTTIRATTTKARLTDPQPFPLRTVEYVARALEQEGDYDPNHFRMFKVVQRATKSGGRSSSDDLSKLTSNICFLAIGIHKIHLVPLPKPTKPTSSTSLFDLNGASHGITTLTCLTLQAFDDAFQLTFRLPLQRPSVLYLASSCVSDIALWIRHAAEYLRPEWIEQPFTWNVPQSLDEEILPVLSETDDYRCFDRTLVAYCSGYDVDASVIRYSINDFCEDAPAFELLPLASSRRTKYTAVELLAILRALRYNESFRSISFRDVKLDALYGLRDCHGSDEDAWTTRSGGLAELPKLQGTPCLMMQEIQALALKSRQLRRLDFSYCLTKPPKSDIEYRDAGSGICEPLFPLCTQQLTNVDWVILTGITLSDIDIDFLYTAAIRKSCHFRALDLGSCGLSDQGLRTILPVMAAQEDTLESLDLSGNPARLDPDSLGKLLSCFKHLRKLNLSNVQLNAVSSPLIPAQAFLLWKLEVVDMSGTLLNEQTVQEISTYLASSQSRALREIRLKQCALTGKEVASLLHAISTFPDRHRDLHLDVSDNRLEQHHDMLADAIGRSMAPNYLTMQMLEYRDESNFQALIEALSKNTSIRCLDISKTSLPADAGIDTCHLLRRMFEENHTLEELNISGEQAHLEAVKFGSGLNNALKGLERNSSLKVLRVEYQSLGLQGASTLASILEQNSTLHEIYCDNNEINLQAFTVLVNGVEHNTSLLYLPAMEGDQAWSRKRIDREIGDLRDSSWSMPPKSAKGTVRRTFGAAMAGGRSTSSRSTNKLDPVQSFTSQDLHAAVGSLSEKWDRQVARLRTFLTHNYCVANGLPLPEDSIDDAVEGDRPQSSGSLITALKQARVDRTPTAEFEFKLGETYSEELNEKVHVLGLGDSDRSGDFSEGKEFNEKLIDLGEEGVDVEGSLMMQKKVQG
ncbi:hypothetical protein MMC06_006351 [Schaereria dolodes]|nr:hypothetical protein [Schaereria dolodes]